MKNTVLIDYLSGKDRAEFAEAVGTTPNYISQIAGGHKSPSLDMMRRIKAATKGVVGLDTWELTDE